MACQFRGGPLGGMEYDFQEAFPSEAPEACCVSKVLPREGVFDDDGFVRHEGVEVVYTCVEDDPVTYEASMIRETPATIPGKYKGTLFQGPDGKVYHATWSRW